MRNEYLEEDEALAPNFPSHPGLVLKLDVLPARKIRGATLAAAIGAARPGVTKMLNGNTAVTPAMALRIERAIGYPAELLVAMQGNYDLAEARRRDADMLAEVVPIAEFA